MSREGAAWRPFFWGALGLTVTAGALTGALDLWSLRVTHHPVPVDHHRGHALAQVFGFLGLLGVGLALELVPRVLGGVQAPSRAFTRALTWSALGGAALLVVGRLGALVPGSRWLGLLGAVATVGAFSAWGGWLLRLARRGTRGRFLVAGAGWWWLAAVTVLAWQAGQSLGWALGQAVPLEAVWVMGLLGGAGSWLAACVPLPRRVFLVWQPMVALAGGVPWVQERWFDVVGALAVAVGVALLMKALPREGRAVQAGGALLVVAAALGLWAVGGGPVLLRDAARHCLTLGVAVLVFELCRRVVPTLAGRALEWPRAFEAGLAAVSLAAVLRLGELVEARGGLALAGASGGVALLGVVLVSASLMRTAR